MTAATAPRSVAAAARALAGSCHPGPSVAVTAFAVLLAVASGDRGAVCVLVGAAVLAGQLSIGWSNDRLDLQRDRRVERVDKPMARGDLSPRSVDAAIAVAGVAVVALSLSLGVRAGLVHLGAVAFGLLYNVGLKATWLSWLPYAVAFGALPGVATLAGAGHPAPAAWLVAAGALIGVTAHLANALPDLDDDARTGVRGLPQRLGARPSLVLATTLLVAGSLVIVLGPSGRPGVAQWLALAVNLVAAFGGLARAWSRPTSKESFYGVIVVVAVDLVLIATT